MRSPLSLLLAGTALSLWAPDVPAEGELARRFDIHTELRSYVRQRLPSYSPGNTSHDEIGDPDVLKLPPFLVSAPWLRTPTTDETIPVRVPAVGMPSYTSYVRRDQKQQDNLGELLYMADLARIGGDPAMSKQLRREAYRALTRDPTPLEHAMDRSANGGRY